MCVICFFTYIPIWLACDGTMDTIAGHNYRNNIHSLYKHIMFHRKGIHNPKDTTGIAVYG